jgi:hypothetical protein
VVFRAILRCRGTEVSGADINPSCFVNAA